MPISSSTLAAIQKVGAAAFAADDKLKKEVQSYAERVNMAMVKNPYNLGNDALIEAWKVVARLSKTMMGIEEELRSLHRVATELTQDEQPTVRDMPALAAPETTKRKITRIDAAVTTVKVKPPAKPKTKKAATSKVTKQVAVNARTKVKPQNAPAAGALGQAKELKGNSAKLMSHLKGLLNATTFIDINQSAVAKVAGIPVGSMGATLKRLVNAGQIVVGNNGSLKLVMSPSATTQA